jgi:hypothetical protein
MSRYRAIEENYHCILREYEGLSKEEDPRQWFQDYRVVLRHEQAESVLSFD